MGDGEADEMNGLCEQPWRGCSMEEIYRDLPEFELQHVPPVSPSDTHTVLYHYPIREAETGPPRPLRAHQKWDACHVRLPCSPKSQYPVVTTDGSSSIEPRWEMIQKALLRSITSSYELQDAILSYNSKYSDKWNFRALHKLFEDELDESETRVFFEDLLPRITRLALRLPDLVQAPIPLLSQGKTQSITLSQQQISCLLANAFLCTFPRRNTHNPKSEYSSFPDINFNRLFQSSGHAVLEKIKCLCHYFRRVCPTERDSSNVPTGVVTFTRRSLSSSQLPDWDVCEAPIGATPLHITSVGTIEDQGAGLLQVDFANKFLGGGVLGGGCVQEEIRFVICPELIISKLFTECLRPTEALLMVGCERFSNYSGYASSFEWAGNYEDCTPRDSSRRRMTHVVAIDALSFSQSSHQFRHELMMRELNKAYVGFLHELKTPAPGVASGNWGCGAFGGESTLKALLQLMVCSVTKRPLVYYTFGDAELRDQVHKMHTYFIENGVLVKDLWGALKQFQPKRLAPEGLYDHIYACLARKNSPSLQNTRTMTSKATEDDSDRPGTSYATQAASTSAVKVKADDIFDSSSDESNGTEGNGRGTESADVRINISDDSETDVALCDAVDKAVAPTTSKSQKPQTPTRKEFRQLTLREMIDQCYTGVGAPVSKRHCQGKKQTPVKSTTTTAIATEAATIAATTTQL